MRGAPPPGTRPVLKASVRLHWTGPAQQIASAAGPAQRWLVFNTGWPAGSSTHAASLQGGFGGCHLLPLRLSAAAAGWLRCGTVVLWLQQSAPAQASMEGGIALGRPGGRCPTRCRARPGDWRCHGCRRQRAPAALPAALPSAASHQSRRLPAVQRRHCVPCRHTLGCTRAQPPAVGVYSCCRLPGRSGSKGPCCRACPARRARACRLAQVALHACSQLWLHAVNALASARMEEDWLNGQVWQRLQAPLPGAPGRLALPCVPAAARCWRAGRVWGRLRLSGLCPQQGARIFSKRRHPNSGCMPCGLCRPALTRRSPYGAGLPSLLPGLPRAARASMLARASGFGMLRGVGSAARTHRRGGAAGTCCPPALLVFTD